MPQYRASRSTHIPSYATRGVPSIAERADRQIAKVRPRFAQEADRHIACVRTGLQNHGLGHSRVLSEEPIGR
eukprot:1682795-Rhodomonas_salina.2